VGERQVSCSYPRPAYPHHPQSPCLGGERLHKPTALRHKHLFAYLTTTMTRRLSITDTQVWDRFERCYGKRMLQHSNAQNL